MHALHRVPHPAAATADPHLCHRLMDTHGQVRVSLFWGHCSFLLGPGVHKVLFVPSKSLFPQSCVSSGSSTVGLMVTSSKRAYATPRSAAPRAPAPAAEAAADPQLCRRLSNTVLLSLCGTSGSWCMERLLGPSKCLWQVWGLILNMISPLLPSFWGFSFILGRGVSFWWDPTFSCQRLFSSEL